MSGKAGGKIGNVIALSSVCNNSYKKCDRRLGGYVEGNECSRVVLTLTLENHVLEGDVPDGESIRV